MTSAGTKQVSVLNHEEKRAFTLTVGISGNGDLLPFHSTFKGKSNQSLPKKTAAKYDEAKEIGFIFSYSKTDTYWATAEIVKLYISEIVVPYWNKKKEELGCLSTQECILQIDVWAVHRSRRSAIGYTERTRGLSSSTFQAAALESSRDVMSESRGFSSSQSSVRSIKILSSNYWINLTTGLNRMKQGWIQPLGLFEIAVWIGWSRPTSMLINLKS